MLQSPKHPPKKNPFKPVAKMASMPLLRSLSHLNVLERDFGKDILEGKYLLSALSAAVPLWMMQYKDWTPKQRQEEIDNLNDIDFCYRMEYVLHRGPKEGDTARAFNDLAKAVALLSFCPGGVRVFGVHWDWQRVKVPT